MKKRVKCNNNIKSKISIILLIMIIFSIMIPNYSDAALGVLTNPIGNICMTFLDSVNGTLASVFANDSKIKETINNAGEDWETIKTAEGGLLSKILTALDKCEDAYYNLLLSPDDIFSGKVQITNANIFSDKFDENGELNTSDFNLFNHLMKQLKQTTAGLYYVMRNLAIVILLCLLIYCGIRIILSSNNSGEKAKWKMYLIDWVKALALVMFIHFIMIGVFYIAELVTEGLQGALMSDNTIVTEIRKQFNDTISFNGLGSFVYIIMYAYVTYLTIVFLVAYFKRLFYVIVLIIISPIMSALYAMGKTSKANFNRWFKEFTFGVFVQPFHMLVYTVLFAIPLTALSSGGNISIRGVTVAQWSSIDVQIYALISIAMIRPIERYLRKVFGFGETTLDNVASFESGKKTIDAGVKVVKEVVKDVGMVAATVATAGAAAPLLGAGAAGAAGAGAAGAAGAGAAGAAGAGAGAAGAGAAGAGATGLEGINMDIGEIGDTSFLGSGLPGEDLLTGDPFHDDFFAGDEFYDNNMQRTMPEQWMSEDQLQDELNGYRESGLDEEGIRNIEDSMRGRGHGEKTDYLNNEIYGVGSSDPFHDDFFAGDEFYDNNMQGTMPEERIQNIEDSKSGRGHGEKTNDLGNETTNSGENLGKGNSTLDGREVVFNNANVRMNQSQQQNDINGVNTIAIDSADKVETESESKENDKKTADKDKDVLEGSSLARALGGRVGGTIEAVQSNPYYKSLTSLESRESLQNVRASMHEFVDTLYISDPPKEWNANVEYAKKEISEKKEQKVNNFINNPANQQKLIKDLDLKDKVNSKTGEVTTAEQQAKEKLKDMAPYVHRGIEDVEKIVAIQKFGSEPKEAMRTYLKETKAQTKVQNFIRNENNIHQMRNLVADRMNIPQEQRSDMRVIQQIDQQVKQEINEGAKYISSGAARDSETLDRLVRLERRIDEQVDMRGTDKVSKPEYVVKADKIIEKAIRDNMKNIRLPGASAKIEVKKLQDALNKEFEERKGLNSGSSTSQRQQPPKNSQPQQTINPPQNN